MKYVTDFEDYTLLDMKDFEKLEKWGDYVLLRPDPQIIWKKDYEKNINIQDVHARYIRSDKGGGGWKINKKMPSTWKIKYKNMTFNLKLMGFKHTGIFPEQAVNWNYLIDKIKKSNRSDIKVLNLFAYTGAATLACLSAGASVCHVDSSNGIVSWAKENVKASDLDETKVRYIVDDVKKFVKREIKRNNKYDIIIMDPPSYGRGKNKEVWNIETDLYDLLLDTMSLLSDKPLCVLVNTYTGGFSGSIISDCFKIVLEKLNKANLKGNIESYEIGLKMKNKDLFLPCGITTKWESEEV